MRFWLKTRYYLVALNLCQMLSDLILNLNPHCILVVN
jgi:hypothetical protein